MRDLFRFALDSFSTNRRRVLLTVAILAVGVASLVGIETAVGVLTDKVAGSFDKLGAGLFTIRPKDGASSIDGRQAAVFAAAFPAPAVVSGWHVRQTALVARSGGKATDPVVQLLATDAAYLPSQRLSLASGRNFSPYEVDRHARVALIGDNVRRKLFASTEAVGKELSVAGERYRIVGVLARQGAVFGTGLDASILCPMDAAEPSCAISVRTPSASEAALLVEAGNLMTALRRLPPGAEPDFEIVQADSAQASLSSLRAKLSLVALAIGLITMLGAAVGLMNSMLVSVKERTREIGTRRALGAKARTISRQFLGEALLIGLSGSAAGILLGLLLGNLVALTLDGGFTIPWGWIAAAVLLASSVSLASGLLPARRAAALDPIEALRSL